MCPSCRWRDPATRAGSPEPVIENRCGTAPPGPHKAFSGPNTARTLGVRPPGPAQCGDDRQARGRVGAMSGVFSALGAHSAGVLDGHRCGTECVGRTVLSTSSEATVAAAEIIAGPPPRIRAVETVPVRRRYADHVWLSKSRPDPSAPWVRGSVSIGPSWQSGQIVKSIPPDVATTAPASAPIGRHGDGRAVRGGWLVESGAGDWGAERAYLDATYGTALSIDGLGPGGSSVRHRYGTASGFTVDEVSLRRGVRLVARPETGG